jgi:hypothetical protein
MERAGTTPAFHANLLNESLLLKRCIVLCKGINNTSCSLSLRAFGCSRQCVGWQICTGKRNHLRSSLPLGCTWPRFLDWESDAGAPDFASDAPGAARPFAGHSDATSSMVRCTSSYIIKTSCSRVYGSFCLFSLLALLLLMAARGQSRRHDLGMDF